MPRKIVLEAAVLARDGSMVCIDCGGRCEFVRGEVKTNRGRLNRSWWRECLTCGGRYAAKPNGMPVGKPADRVTRYNRILAHRAFDPLIQGVLEMRETRSQIEKLRRNKGKTVSRIVNTHRRRCYRWLAEQLGLSNSHIGNLNAAQCQNVITVCEGATAETIIMWWKKKNAH